MIEPNVWEVVPEPYHSSYGFHVPRYPGFMRWSGSNRFELFFECFYLQVVE